MILLFSSIQRKRRLVPFFFDKGTKNDSTKRHECIDDKYIAITGGAVKNSSSRINQYATREVMNGGDESCQRTNIAESKHLSNQGH